jgi:hypothetical protein
MLLPSVRRLLFTFAALACCLPALARDPVPVALPATPDGTIKAIGTALGDGKFEVVWQAMPASYQSDVKKLLVEFSKKMDADLWDQGNKVGGKVAKILTDKAEFIVATPAIAKQLEAKAVKPADAKTYLTSMGGVISDVQSNVASLPQLEKLEPEKLLANLGPKVKELNEVSSRMGIQAPGQSMADWYKVEAKLVSSTDSSAKVELTKADGKTETVELVKVEGKWVPKDMADSWSKNMEQAMKGLEAMQITAEQKQQVNMITGIASGVLDTFLNAKTQADFDAAVNGAMAMMGGGLPGAGGPPQPRQLQPLP